MMETLTQEMDLELAQYLLALPVEEMSALKLYYKPEEIRTYVLKVKVLLRFTKRAKKATNTVL